jgi:hypothetical protein
MPFGCKTKVEKAWLVASLTALVLHRLLEVDPDADGLWLIETLIVVLTFPCGPVAMLFLAIGVEAMSDRTDLSWLLDWSTLLVVGYLQWFWVLPEIRRNNRLTIVNLSSSVELDSPSEIAAPAPPPGSLNLPELPPAPVAFNAAAFVPPLAQFDEAGLTALDRVLRAEVSSLSAP